MTTDTSNENDSSIENKTATVSIRNMSLKLWYKAGYECKLKGVTISDYITRLIEADLGEDSSNEQ